MNPGIAPLHQKILENFALPVLESLRDLGKTRILWWWNDACKHIMKAAEMK